MNGSRGKTSCDARFRALAGHSPTKDGVVIFRADITDPSILDPLARDHVQAVSELGVFGTPTFVFADGAGAYVRLAESVNENEALDVFDRLMAVAATEPRILEIKRPRRPSQA